MLTPGACCTSKRLSTTHRRTEVKAQAASIPSRRDILLGTAGASSLLLPSGPGLAVQSNKSIYNYSALQNGQPVSLAKYTGQVLIVVNTASLEPLQSVNFPGLRELLLQYYDLGLNVVAFPCNQFGAKAPGTSDEEREWAQRKMGFPFDVYDKIEVNGRRTHPLYLFLRQRFPISYPAAVPKSLPAGNIEWNYVKFLIDRSGQPVQRYKPFISPLDFEDDVKLVLAGKSPLPQDCMLSPGRDVCDWMQYLMPEYGHLLAPPQDAPAYSQPPPQTFNY